MSNIKANSVIQTINLTANQGQTKKIAIKPGQAIQLMVDGQLYAGQQHINGKAVRLVRKGRTLEVQLDEQTLAVVEDFYANEGAATGQTQALSEQDTLALLQESSVVQVAAAPAGEAAGTVPLPQWGTLVAQASTSTAGNAPATVAAASAVPEATGMGTALLGVLGLAALAGASSSKSSSPAPMPPDTTAPTVMVTDNVSGTATGAVTFTVKFSEAVTGFDASKLSLSGGTLGGLVRVSDSEYNVQATPAANATGTLQLSVSTSGVTDAAGNLAVAPAVAAQAYNTVPPDAPDTTAATVMVTDNVSGTATGAVTFTVKFSEAVTGFDANKLSLSGGSLGALTKVSDSEYTVVATPATTATGTLQLSVNTSGVTDAAGNTAVAPAVASQAYAQNVLQGNIMAGPVVGTHQLSVKVFNAAGQAIANAMVDASGNYKVALGSYTGPVSVLVVDADNTKADYVDEVKKQAVDLTASLLAAGSVVNSANVQTININPATTVAANKAGVQATTDGQAVQAITLSSAELAAKISQSNIAVAKALNIGTTESSLLSTSVVATVTTAGQDNLSNANTYGKVLATLSALDQIKGSTEAAILALVQSISDQGTLSTAIQAQLVQAAAVANVPATTVVPGYQPPSDAPVDPVLSMSFAGKTAAETATLLNGLSANQKSLLSAAQGAQIQPEQLDDMSTLAALSPAFISGMSDLALASLPLTLVNSLTTTQLEALTAAQIQALANANLLTGLTNLQIAALGDDITGLSAAQLAGLTDTQLGGLTPTQIAALAAAGDLASLSAPQIAALGDDITGLSATQVAALNSTHVGGLTAAQINALNTAGLLDNLASPLSSTQISGAAPAGLGFTAVDTADERAMFNAAIDAQAAGNINLTNLAAAVSKIGVLADGTNNDAAQPTQDEYTALGITGIDSAAKAELLGDVLDVKVAADANELAEIQTLATAASAVAAYTGSNTAPTNAQLNALLGTSFVNDNNRAAFLDLLDDKNLDGTPVTLAELLAIRNGFVPTLSTELSSLVTNLDPRSALVLTSTEALNWKPGTHTFTITNDATGNGKSGFRTETTAHTQTITVNVDSNGQVTSATGGSVSFGDLAKTKIVIDPTYDLDLSNNYTLSLSVGAFTGQTTSLTSAAFTPVSFATVTPGTSTAFYSGDDGSGNPTIDPSKTAASRIMNTTTGALGDSLNWVDVTNAAAIGQDIANGVYAVVDASAKDYAFVTKNISAGSSTMKITDTGVKFTNFGANDLLYIDNQFNDNLSNWLPLNTFGRGVGSSSDPFQVVTSGSSLATYLQFVIDASVTLPASYTTGPYVNSLLSTVNGNQWSTTGVVIAA